MALISRIRKSLTKHLPELAALATGKMPAFIYGTKGFTDIPVFCFHAVEADRFERQLRFLRENGYVALDSQELDSRLNDPAYRNNGTEVVLTFDDGLISLWTVALPLLKKYGVKAVSFILPGLTADADAGGEAVPSRLCSWTQIRSMHQSGLVDFQSHGLVHPLISVESSIVDFVHPGYPSDYNGIPEIPFYGDGTPRGDQRKPVLGHPVYRYASRYSGKLRYFDDLRLRQECAEFVRRQGSTQFFHRNDWRRRLAQVVQQFKSRSGLAGRVETPEERDQALRYELGESKRLLELHLPGKQVKHFCNPWYVGSELMARMALEAGYSSLHLGATVGFAYRESAAGPRFILRLQEEYLSALPGRGRTGLLGIFRQKLNSSRLRKPSVPPPAAE